MMGSNAELYGMRKSKNIPRETSSSTSLAFASTLTSLLPTSSSRTTSSGRPQSSKKKSGIFTSNIHKKKKRIARDIHDAENESDAPRKVGRKDVRDVDEATLHNSKQKLQAKAKIYAQMRRGELFQDEEALVDFDQKWAEQKDPDFELDNKSDDDRGHMVEYEDEYGRSRCGTRVEAEKTERNKQKARLDSEELWRMSARPAMPDKLIYGDTIQSLAFNPDEPIVEKMEELAAKRDRSPTPPEMKHYEADKEFRTKGVGFYSFSKDELVRAEEMKALERERLDTERIRRERDEKKEKRLKELEARRRAINDKRARQQAENFLKEL